MPQVHVYSQTVTRCVHLISDSFFYMEVHFRRLEVIPKGYGLVDVSPQNGVSLTAIIPITVGI